jgi:hypothetical protein
VEEALVDLLKAYAPLTALIGTAPARVYWMRAPQNVARPYVVLQVITGLPDVAHSGPTGLVAYRVQADAYGDSYGSTKAVARALAARLTGFKATVFDGVFKDAERDGYEDDASPDKLFRTSQDFIIWHKGA